VIEIDIHKVTKASEILKAVAHPMRMKIISMLAPDKRLSVGTLNSGLNIEQALLSHHLKKMKNAGILDCERNGKQIMYFVSDTSVTDILNCINKL
jgi:DNA-binding transcriptional ArsR family regulator